MQKLGYGVTKYVKKILGQKAFEEYEAMKKWPDVVGEKIAAHTKAIRVRYGKLTIQVDDPAWRNELLWLKPMILQRYEALGHNKTIRDIIFL